MLLDLTELSSYLPLVSSFEFGNVSGDGGAGTRGGPSMAVSAPPGFASHLDPFTHVAEASTRKNGASNAASRRLKY